MKKKYLQTSVLALGVILGSSLIYTDPAYTIDEVTRCQCRCKNGEIKYPPTLCRYGKDCGVKICPSVCGADQVNAASCDVVVE